MNDPLAQMQQQIQAMQAQANELIVWAVICGICINLISAVVGFFVARWFLLHVLGIQQKRFFSELDLFLYQRGIAPHVNQPAPTPQRAPSAVTSAPQAQPSCPIDPYAEKTPMEKAWEQLTSHSQRMKEDDSRFKPRV